ncbi:MAG: NAD(P)-dependent oxidoreductase [Oscillospiraceae bacterium]|nr:NAD(P)-dependent oxidoreductase [Oscillospiraceae bacterium]
MIRTIVTGGSGFIGYHLADYLSRKEDVEVTVIDNHARGSADEMFCELTARKNVVYLNADMTKTDFYKQLTGKYDYIYHLAAINGTKNFYEQPYKVLQANILTLMNMLQWCTPDCCGAFLFSSSSETYAGTCNCFLAEHPEFIPSREDIPLAIDDVLNPRWSYGGSKIIGEILTTNYCRTQGIPFKIIRYHNIYGIRMGFDHVLPEFFRRIYRRENPFRIYGGQETRAFCAVEDGVRATEAVMLSEKCSGEIIHIGNGSQEIKIIDLMRKVFDLVDFHPDVDVLPAPRGCVMRRCPDTNKLKALAGYQASVSLDEALPEMYAWYMEQYAKMQQQ